MNKKEESILSPAQKRALLWALAALVVCAAMNIYHYSLQGARGLYLWNRTGMFRALILMGLVPIGFVFLSFPLDKLKTKAPASFARGLSILLSILVAAASAGILVMLVAGPRMGSLAPARLSLVDPSKGLGRVDRSEPTMSSSAQAPSGAPSAKTEPAEAIAEPGAALDAGPRLSISISSDPHWGAETASASDRTDVLASVAEHKPDAFFILGDMTETGSKASEWNFALADLEAILPKTPIRTLMGNHDALLGGQLLYKKAFFPAGMGSDSGSPYYYSIADEEGTFIFLNLPWGTENFGKAQRSWLEKTLAAADQAKPILVFSHSFFYASGYDDPELDKPWYDHYQNIPALSPLFEKYGVDLVVSGHNHYQELLEKNGVNYAVIGAMGGIPDPSPAYVSPASTWIAVATHGRLDLDFYEGELVLTFRDASGNPLHEKRIPR